ncbi:MAG: SAM-dependent methyltransferase, partial [Candidatus Limnocylindria bacterium]
MVEAISYPYEWCFGQLQAAALLTLDIQSRALDAGMRLRDASAYNVQFEAGRPIFIDSLSFEVAPDTEPWPAYRQFCEHFLAPLALMALRDPRCGLMLRDFIDGIPLDLAAS